MGTERLLIEVTSSGARVVQGQISDIGKEARKSETAVTALKRALQFGIAALGIREAIRTMTDFSREMARVSVASGATGDALRRLGDEARRIGAETNAGAAEAARALGILQRAGLASAASVGALQQALRLASATGSDSASSTAAFANVMQAFKLDVEDASEAIDILAITATKSNASFEELASGIARTAHAAQGAGIGLRETAALISVLNDAGLEGRIAMTQLREALEGLEGQTASERAVFQALGLDVQKIRPSVVGLSAALEELGRRDVRLEDLGVKGGRALDILASRTPDVQRLLATLDQGQGSAERFAKVMDESLAGAFKSVKVAADELITAFGVEGGIAGAVRNIAESVRLLTREVQFLRDLLRDTRTVVGVPELTPKARAGLEEMSTAERKRMNDAAAALRAEMARPKLDLDMTFEETLARVPARGGAPPAAQAQQTVAAITTIKNELRTVTEVERLRVDLTKQLGSAQADLVNTQEALQTLLRDGIINQQQYNLALAATIREAQTLATGLDSLKASFLAVDTSVGAIAGSIGDTLVGSIDSASNALADFAISGFRDVENFKQALSDLFADLGKQVLALIFKMLILKAIQAAIGGGGGGVTEAVAPLVNVSGVPELRQHGGPVQRGRDYIVGEDGPELFRAPADGTVVPAGQTAEALSASMPVTIINNLDPEMVGSYMASAAGERIIVNTIRKNKRALDALG